MNYRNTRSYLNCEKRIFDGTGEFDFPQLKPIDIDFDGLQCTGFNYAIGEKHPEDKILHFYVDDYQFIRVWRDADKYISILQKFKAVLTPDFSLYTDFPKAVQIFNHYRKQWLGAYWQENGITVIPTLCWSDESSFDWCFDGIPKNSIVSVSTVGGFKNEETKAAWLKGYKKCVEVLEPSKILLFGNKWKETELEYNRPIEIIVMENNQIKRFRQMKVLEKV